ncbi:MAG: hypothetical protein ACK5QS_07770 [Pseudanabaenaceae cyanobacterium]
MKSLDTLKSRIRDCLVHCEDRIIEFEQQGKVKDALELRQKMIEVEDRLDGKR